MKRFLILFAAAMTMSAIAVSAQEIAKSDYALTEQEQEDLPVYSVLVNGKGFINFKGQTPYNKGGYVFIPVRGVFEQMGFEVDFDAETKTAYLNSPEHSVEITLGNEYFTADGNTIYPQVPQFILNGSFMLPIRAVSEAIGVDVGYNPETYVITLNYQENDPNKEAPWVITRPSSSNTTEETTEETTEATETAEPIDAFINFTLDNTKLRFGQTNVPTPSRKYSSPYGFTWYVYNTTPAKFNMLGINENGEIVAFYAQSPGFSFEGIEYGADAPKKFTAPTGYTAKYYTKKGKARFSDDQIYGLFVCMNAYMDNITLDETVLNDMEDQIYSMLMAERMNEGLGSVLETSPYNSADVYAKDLAENNGNASKSFEDVLVSTNDKFKMPEYVLYETTAPATLYFDIVSNVLNDYYAYDSLTYNEYYFIDTGLSASEVSDTIYYAQNIYVDNDSYDK